MGVTTTLIKGGRGIFDVKVDGVLIYSKFSTGRFPRTGELSELTRAKKAEPR